MKFLTSLLFVLLLVGVARGGAAPAPIPADAPVFNGVMTIGSENRFVLVAKDGKSSPWIKLGESFADYSLKSYEPKESALELERDGKSIVVHLDSGRGTQQGGAVAMSPGTLSAANDLMKVMRFEEMMTKMMDTQAKSMGPMLRGTMEQAAARLNLTPEEQKDLTDFQEKTFRQLFESLTGPEFRNEMMQVYSDVFSQEELSAQAAFYSTPAGKSVVEKTPEMQAKMQAAMAPRLMAGMGQVQQSLQNYMRDLARKRAAAGQPVTPVVPAK